MDREADDDIDFTLKYSERCGINAYARGWYESSP